ncbi:MAG TPA: VgrG-related protein [Planctomycetaceae bacterium]|jgi:phage protein D|nr:VgrG-related protein [Planctomycetaceae bacterium]
MSETSSLISQVHVKIDGNYVSEEFMQAVVEVSVESSLHMPDVTTIVLHDPKLRWIDDPLVAPGKAVEILTTATSAQSQSRPVFDGEIVEIEPDFAQGTQHLAIRAFDRLHRLGRGRMIRSFQNVTDSDVAQKIAPEVGLQADVEPTKEVHQYLFQNNQTNFEFLQERAAALGYLLYVEGKKLCFKPPAPDTQPVDLKWAANLSEFRPRLTTLAQINTSGSRGWDPRTKKEIVSETTKADGVRDIGQKKHGGEMAKGAFHIDAANLVVDRPIRTQVGADRIAQAVADRIEERFVEAEGACGGNPAIVAGSSVKIESVGDQFSGAYLVTAANHVYSAREGYTTRFSISGQTPSTLLRLLRDEKAPQAVGAGLVIGLVTDNQDPEGWGRVKVKYPWFSADHASDWARVVVTGGGDQRGIEFLPEVNDEVLVGFEMGDVHLPYVIGGLWNGKDAPPRKNSEIVAGGRVKQRIIRSRTGHIVILDDSDGNSGITIADKNDNRISLESGSNKLTIDVKGDISIHAGGRIEIKGATIDLN